MTLYTNETQTRFFDIPDDAEVPPGALKLSSLMGRERALDAAAVKAFEIPEEVAQERAEAEVASVQQKADAAAEGLTGVVEQLRVLAGALAEPQGAQTLSEALGVPGDLRDDPDAALAGLRQAGDGVVELLRSLIDPDAPKSSEGRVLLRGLAEAVAKAGGPDWTDQVDEVPAKLRERLGDPKLVEAIRDLTASMGGGS